MKRPSWRGQGQRCSQHGEVAEPLNAVITAQEESSVEFKKQTAKYKVVSVSLCIDSLREEAGSTCMKDVLGANNHEYRTI
ncbi:hypothetical protein EYF80_046763 [Liparis tanakae]|uniref:Uncharacterized protein n=1 Tax=Liparis tanakae TaxID=230148 RepID=A0A4Z2FQH3_9TELE|nr:hypothetical protein EYF80_046763 [Liparis tanakae]